MKTYTEDEFTAAVKEAVTPIQEAANLKVAELQGKLDELTTESEKAELDGQIAEMQSALDIADAKVAAAEKTLADTLSYFDFFGGPL
jgi:molecular chaperone GrpE (heat shock protein)